MIEVNMHTCRIGFNFDGELVCSVYGQQDLVINMVTKFTVATHFGGGTLSLAIL